MLFYLMMGFLLGGLLGLVLLLWVYLKAEVRIRVLEEDKQLVHYEKRIVMDFLHNLIEGLGENISREELFGRIVGGSVRSTTALSACLFEKSGDALVRVASEGLFPPLREMSKEVLEGSRIELLEKALEGETFALGEGLIGSVVASGEAVIIKDAGRDPRVARSSNEALRIYSIIVAPIVFSQEVLGVLAVANPIDGSGFNDADLSLIESFAEQAGLVIYNCGLIDVQREKQKMDFDLSMASNIQRMILPKELPDMEGLDIASFYHPAQSVGGDLYGTFKTGERKVGVAVADVSGKGIPASLLMSICQTNLHHFAPTTDSPSELLTHLNREMMPSIRQSMFITLIYAVVDLGRHTLTFARAGHEKLLFLKAGGQHAEFVAGEGVAVGMVPEDLFGLLIGDVSLDFEVGDIAVLYTDGVTECVDEHDMEFSAARLASHVEASRDRSAQGIADGLFERLEGFAGACPFPDDLSFIVLKRV